MSECVSHHLACECREALFADLVEAARDVSTPVRPSEAVLDRLETCLARIDARDRIGDET